MKTAFAAAVIFAGFGLGGASAGSIVELRASNEISSVIELGDPDPCADGACGSEEDVEMVDAGSAAGGALVDQYGMPTKMPVVMRPSVDSPATQPAPAAGAPATATAPQTQTPQPEPVKAEPAPQVETPTVVNQNGEQMPQPEAEPQ
jgi:hypothetical protein